MTERASGWYDDPEDPNLLRYWDGILWSERTMPKVKPNLDQSRIGDARRQYEDEQERLRAQHAPADGRPQRTGSPMRPYQPTQQDPYARQQAMARPVKTTPDGEQTASWWRRLFAYFIDNVLLSIVAVVLAWKWLQPWVSAITNWYGDALDAARANHAQPPLPNAVYHVPWQIPAVTLALYLIYEIGLIAWRGQTIGHLLCGIRVRGAQSSTRPELRAVVIRALVKGIGYITELVPLLASLGTIFSLVDGLVPLGDRNSQALHDKAAGTYVVRTKPKLAQPDSPFLSAR